MNRKKVWLEAQVRNFQEIPNGVQWEAVIFSSEFNRNKSYFDIQKMKRWAGKLEKVLLNNNHKGKYFSVQTDKVVELKVETNETGVTEAYAIVQSINEEKRKNPEMVTGFSIELMVDGKDVIANENGEYYIDYEWVGLAYLTGELAGSGDTRLLSMKTFSQSEGENNQNNNNSMNEEQIKALLAEQEAKLTAAFAQKEAELKKFAEELVSKQQSTTNGEASWKGEDGKIYTEKWQNIYTSIITAMTEDEPSEPQVLGFLAQKFGYIKKEEETDEQKELNEIMAGFAALENEKKEKIKKAFKAIKHEEKVPDRDGAENTADEAKLPEWYKKLSN